MSTLLPTFMHFIPLAHYELACHARCAQAREEALMKPSVARKLNERIRSLEGELELLRSNKKVSELEKKVQVGPLNYWLCLRALIT